MPPRAVKKSPATSAAKKAAAAKTPNKSSKAVKSKAEAEAPGKVEETKAEEIQMMNEENQTHEGKQIDEEKQMNEEKQIDEEKKTEEKASEENQAEEKSFDSQGAQETLSEDKNSKIDNSEAVPKTDAKPEEENRDKPAEENKDKPEEENKDNSEKENKEEKDVEMEGAEHPEEGTEQEGIDAGTEQEGVDAGEDERPQEEMPEPVKQRRKQKEYEIFVGGLDRDATEDDLRKVFSEVGEIVEIRLAKMPRSDKNSGFAFIRFATVEQVKRALTELKNPKVRGKQCGVTKNQDNETLYVRNISRTWTKEALTKKLKEYGIDNVVELTLVDDPKEEGKNRGFAFLEFNTHLEATNAFKRLQKRDVFFGMNIGAKVEFAVSGIEPDEEVMAQVKSIFVDGLPPTWDEDHVKEKFNTFGEIEQVQLARNMPTAKRKDFAFVSFTTREAALACIEAINKNEITDGDKKLSMKATLRKPQQKGKSVKDSGIRGSRGPRAPWVRGISSFDNRRGASRGGLGRVPAGRFQDEYSYRGYGRRPAAPPVRVASRRDFREDDYYYHGQPRSSRYPIDDYGYQGPEMLPSSRSRMPYMEESYSRVLSGSKRPQSDLIDDGPLYGGRPGRARLDYDAVADSRYGGSLYPDPRSAGVYSGEYPGRDAGGRSYPSGYGRGGQAYY
eukprot:TRINITY_DN9580_c0_g2_i1.p1 TRINITY_DN9580_c0_g2~~TRINITY_DN9580_c0_g2_i1.p1  ORF type:complete len:671 (+),score=190.84 TRINITY_DN9580_c0_g2_i1:207-2219(+)